jgi:hypothetical protein
LLRNGDERALASLEGDATWIAISRRQGLRRSLGGRVCLVWRVAVEDTCGRLVESKLVPVLVDVQPSGRRRSPSWIRSVLQQVDSPLRAQVEGESEAWLAEVMRLASAFSSTRLRRERDVAGQGARGDVVSQPGLFDRRAERSREAHAAAAAESERATAARLRDTAAAGELAPAPAQLLLVLVA